MISICYVSILQESSGCSAWWRDDRRRLRGAFQNHPHRRRRLATFGVPTGTLALKNKPLCRTRTQSLARYYTGFYLGTTIACVLAVSMTCVTCLVSGGDRPSRVGSSYAPLCRSVAPLCINRCIAHSGVWLPTEGGACLDKYRYRSLIRLGWYTGW